MANKTLTKPSVIRRTTNDVAAVDDHSPRTFANINGDEVEYDTCSALCLDEGDDLEYLGYGQISRYDDTPSTNKVYYFFYRRIQTK